MGVTHPVADHKLGRAVIDFPYRYISWAALDCGEGLPLVAPIVIVRNRRKPTRPVPFLT